ncbi:hypothetical protein ABZ869_05150 [Streptomyces sp. NPDC046928]|uniref:hypothetical protein n=1 Tax=Streptomyces sp. NPDC046928 TaxID=3155021 RepID=UPI0034068C89
MAEEQDDIDYCHLESARELGSFHARIRTAGSRAEASLVRREHQLSEEEFVDRFPELAKYVQGLPETPPHSDENST